MKYLIWFPLLFIMTTSYSQRFGTVQVVNSPTAADVQIQWVNNRAQADVIIRPLMGYSESNTDNGVVFVQVNNGRVDQRAYITQYCATDNCFRAFMDIRKEFALNSKDLDNFKYFIKFRKK